MNEIQNAAFSFEDFKIISFSFTQPTEDGPYPIGVEIIPTFSLTALIKLSVVVLGMILVITFPSRATAPNTIVLLLFLFNPFLALTCLFDILPPT